MEATAYNKARFDAGKIPWSAIEALTLYYQKGEKLDPDGKLGPGTLAHLFPAANAAPPPGIWPLRALPDGRVPTVTSAYQPPERPLHTGNDMFYKYLPTDPFKKIGDSGRTAKWWIPEGTKAIATHAGRIVRANKIATGWRVELAIGGGWSVVYIHLAELNPEIVAAASVNMGDEIGLVGDNPIDYDADHLHFELWHNGERKNPKLLLDRCKVMQAVKDVPVTPRTVTIPLNNGG